MTAPIQPQTRYHRSEGFAPELGVITARTASQGAASSITYTVRLQLDEGQATVAGLAPDAGLRWSGPEVVALPLGTPVIFAAFRTPYATKLTWIAPVEVAATADCEE